MFRLYSGYANAPQLYFIRLFPVVLKNKTAVFVAAGDNRGQSLKIVG